MLSTGQGKYKYLTNKFMNENTMHCYTVRKVISGNCGLSFLQITAPALTLQIVT